MPLYEYECMKCKKEYELYHSIDDLQKEYKCEKCESILKRVILKAKTFFLNGKGWSKDGYSKR